MLRTEDIAAVKLSLDDLSKKSENIVLNKYEPTLSQLDKIYQDIYEYTKQHKLIIYGGWAQNALIKVKNQSDGFYNETSLADIEFYSYDPIGLGIDLAQYLYKKGHQYIQFKEAMHEGTYSIFVNFHNFCDISYMPKYIYDNLPTKNVNGFTVTHPHFMTIDAFRVYSDPMFSFFRIEKTFNRFNTLLKHYPLYNEKMVKLLKTNKLDENVFKTLKKEFVHNKDMIVIHHYAYNYLVKKTNKKEFVSNIPYLSLISVNYTNDIIKITKKLQDIYKNKITFKEYYPFFQFLGRKTEFYLDNKLILVIYAHNERCTVYQATYSENKKTLFGTFSLLRLMLLSEYYNYVIHKNDKCSTEYMILLQNLFFIRNDFLNEKDLTVMDNTPFQEFTFECMGDAINPLRHSMLKIIEKIKQKKPIKFNYDPDMKFDVKKPDYKFPNVSGNPIINSKDFTINKKDKTEIKQNRKSK